MNAKLIFLLLTPVLMLSLHQCDQGISDLSGIEEFINLEQLWCHKNQLMLLDVSANVELRELHCSHDLQRWGLVQSELYRILAYEKTMPRGRAHYRDALVETEDVK